MAGKRPVFAENCALDLQGPGEAGPSFPNLRAFITFHWMLHRLRFLAAVAAWLAATAGCGGSTPSAADKAAPEAVRVDTAAVRLESVDQTIRAVGSLVARQAVVVKPEVSGIVKAIEFREGAAVAKDAVLVHLDDAKLAAERELAAARVASAQANFENADAKLRRSKALVEQKILSSQEFENADAERKSAAAALEEARAALRLAGQKLADMTVRAPFAGIAGTKHVNVGDLVQQGQPLLDLVDLENLEIRFEVPELYVAAIRPSQRVEVGVTSLPGETFAGEVFFVSPQIDPVNRTLALKARVDNRGQRLHPGQFAQVRLVLQKRDGVAVIPEEALVSRQGRFFVFVVDSGAAHEREVTLGERQSGRVAIASGLSGGEVVVRTGHQKLHDGTPVEVGEAKPEAS